MERGPTPSAEAALNQETGSTGVTHWLEPHNQPAQRPAFLDPLLAPAINRCTMLRADSDLFRRLSTNRDAKVTLHLRRDVSSRQPYAKHASLPLPTSWRRR